MSEIKSQKAVDYIEEYYEYITPQTIRQAVIIAETEAEERHSKEIEALKQKAVEAFMEVCPLGHPERFKNVGLQTSAVCPYIDIIGFPCCNDRCPFILALTQKLTEKQ